MQVTELKPQYSIFGNKGNVWEKTSHIYKSGEGNLCGTPALSSNWARIEEVKEIGCEKCIKRYMEDVEFAATEDFERQLEYMAGEYED